MDTLKSLQSLIQNCDRVASELKTFHGIDISEDRSDPHSSTVCSKCYSRLLTLKHSAHPSSTTLEKAKADVESAAKLWVGYDSDLSVSVCPVCCEVSQVSDMQSSRQVMYPCVHVAYTNGQYFVISRILHKTIVFQKTRD